VCVFITAVPITCVCLLLQYLLKSCSRGGRGIVEDDDDAFYLTCAYGTYRPQGIYGARLLFCFCKNKQKTSSSSTRKAEPRAVWTSLSITH
jgi:hypothetical protein